MARQDPITVSATGVADGSDLIIDGSEGSTGAIDVFELMGTVGCDVFRETDPDGDGTFEISVVIEQPAGDWHSQDNRLTVSQAENTRIRITNTSGGAGDFAASGYEVPDGA